MDCEDGLGIPKPVDLLLKKKKREERKEKLVKSPAITESDKERSL